MTEWGNNYRKKSKINNSSSHAFLKTPYGLRCFLFSSFAVLIWIWIWIWTLVVNTAFGPSLRLRILFLLFLQRTAFDQSIHLHLLGFDRREMADQLSKGEEFEKKAEKKLSGWGLFGSKYEDAADLFDKAANCFKLAKSCFSSFLSTFLIIIAFLNSISCLRKMLIHCHNHCYCCCFIVITSIDECVEFWGVRFPD